MSRMAGLLAVLAALSLRDAHALPFGGPEAAIGGLAVARLARGATGGGIDLSGGDGDGGGD
jgi:hypothetical protein